MKRIVLSVTLDVTDNATPEEVRGAVKQCVSNALHLYAKTQEPRPHRITGGPVHTFGSAVRAVELVYAYPRREDDPADDEECDGGPQS